MEIELTLYEAGLIVFMINSRKRDIKKWLDATSISKNLKQSYEQELCDLAELQHRIYKAERLLPI